MLETLTDPSFQDQDGTRPKSRDRGFLYAPLVGMYAPLVGYPQDNLLRNNKKKPPNT